MRTIPALGLCVLWLASVCSSLGQTPVFDINQFYSSSDLALQGSAVISGERLQLTPSEAGRSGGVFFLRKRVLQGGFDTTFAFQLSSPANGGGEGFAFVVQNSAVPALGPAGPGIGFGGILNSLAVEFDTRYSGTGDAAANHISVQVRGTAVSLQTNSSDHSFSLGAITNGLPNFASGNVHTARVVYASSTLEVFVNGGATPVLSVPVDLAARLNLDRGQAWFGFTAANGVGSHAHEILGWSVNLAANPVEVDIATPLDGASFVAPADIPLTATATADGATIARVEYFDGARRVGQSLTNPFPFTWSSVGPGSYSVTAVAFDSLGRTNLSAPIALTVLPAAAPIGINFIPNTPGTDAAMYPTNGAGVVHQRNWNNVLVFTNGTAIGQNLKNGVGMGTTLDLSADFANFGEQTVINIDLSDDHRLMKGFGRDQAGQTGFQTNSTIALSQIPFGIYDLIIYSDGANLSGDRVAQFRIGTNSIYLRDTGWATFSGIYAQATSLTDAGRNTTAGNYVRFNSLNTANLTLNVRAGNTFDGARGAVVNAIQIVPSVFDASVPPTVTRGPYLQTGTPRSMIVRWRTNRPVDSRVRYGTNPDNLDQSVSVTGNATEHTVGLTNLTPNTRYYYSIGTAATNLTSGTNYFFVTSPLQAKPTRIWVLGDAGTAGNGSPTRQASVRDAYYNATAGAYTDLMLMLGDNAYNSGTDTEFQAAVFDMYGAILRQTPLWSCVGNHETAQSHTFNANIPYYRIFDFPRNGEAGGVPSGTEQYYSFDYGNIHFVVLDAMTTSRAADGPMATWLQQDLEANTNHWLIAFWHHPPYTKGSHDSDNPNGADFELVEMRENILPLLESYGVDLVMGGHSHAYERSFLIHGHYGYSTNLVPSMKVDGGSGRFEDDQPYSKSSTTPTPYQGTVYIVAGSSGQATFATTPSGTFDNEQHPAMFISMLQLGSLVLNVNGNRLDGQFLREIGQVQDTFTLFKNPPSATPASSFRITSAAVENSVVRLTWNSEPGKSYIIQRTEDLVNPNWQPVSNRLPAAGAITSWSGPTPPGDGSAYYRVVAEGN